MQQKKDINIRLCKIVDRITEPKKNPFFLKLKYADSKNDSLTHKSHDR